ncbi:MAG: hypothetical protein WCA12_13820 [Burkholderiales bacterium]
MAQQPPARIGDPIDASDTPALVLEFQAFETNRARMADFVRGTRVPLRPHAMAHKCPAIAKRQIALGERVTLVPGQLRPDHEPVRPGRARPPSARGGGAAYRVARRVRVSAASQ